MIREGEKVWNSYSYLLILSQTYFTWCLNIIISRQLNYFNTPDTLQNIERGNIVISTQNETLFLAHQWWDGKKQGEDIAFHINHCPSPYVAPSWKWWVTWFYWADNPFFSRRAMKISRDVVRNFYNSRRGFGMVSASCQGPEFKPLPLAQAGGGNVWLGHHALMSGQARDRCSGLAVGSHQCEDMLSAQPIHFQDCDHLSLCAWGQALGDN